MAFTAFRFFADGLGLVALFAGGGAMALCFYF
jgi:hypothetical protein